MRYPAPHRDAGFRRRREGRGQPRERHGGQHEVSVCCMKRVGDLGAGARPAREGRSAWQGRGQRLPAALAPGALIRRKRPTTWCTPTTGACSSKAASPGSGGARACCVHTVHGPIRYPPGPWCTRASSRCATCSSAGWRALPSASRPSPMPSRRYIVQDIGVPARMLHGPQRHSRPGGGFMSRPASAESVTFITVGRLAAIKNHALMLRAFCARGAVPGPQARLVIVGDGPERAAIERRRGEPRARDTR